MGYDHERSASTSYGYENRAATRVFVLGLEKYDQIDISSKEEEWTGHHICIYE